MTIKTKNNTRGFTLIELLAVIVVLAVIMLIAVNAVIPRMESARKQAFAIEANGLIEAAQAWILTKQLTANSVVVPASGTCVEVETLSKEGYSELNPDKYTGKVIINKATDSIMYTYSVYISNGQFMVNGAGVDKNGNNYDITEEHVNDYGTSFDGTCTQVTTE